MIRWAILCLFAVACALACVAAAAQIDDAPPASASRAQPGQPFQPSAISNETHNQAPTTQKAEESPLRFRRVYVPEKQLLEHVKSGRRYVPMEAAEFETQLARLRARAGPAAQSPAHLAYATYAATLDERFQLTGRGTWNVQFVGKKPTLLALPGLGFALKGPVWGSDAAGLRGDAARLGSTADNQSALFVDRGGAVSFEWSLRGSLDRDGVWVYPLSFPPAATQQLDLTLPNEWVPIVDGGIVSAADDGNPTNRRWTILLAGRSQAELRIARKDSLLSRRAVVVVKPRLTYELTTLGLRLAADLRIDVQGGSVGSLQVDLDPALTLASATLGEAAISVSEASDEQGKRITLEFPEPLDGNNRLIRLTAIAPLTMDESWTLPKLHFPEMIWQDGTITLVFGAPLVLNKLDLAQCRQTKRETTPGPLAGEAIAIQAFTATAGVTIQVAEQSDRLHLKSATTIDLSGDEARSLYVADIAAETGERFELDANVSPDWIIDSVQSVPAGLITDWDRTRSEAGASRLVVQLARAVTPEQSLRLIVQATRRRTPLGDTLSIGNLELLNFDRIVPARRLMLVRSTGMYRLDSQNAEGINRLDPKRLDPNDRNLLADAPRGLLFVLDDASADLKLRLLQEKPRFSAVLQSRAQVSDVEVTESHRLHIAPESGELDMLRVHFSQRREAGLDWSIEDNPSYEVASRRLSTEEHAASGMPDSAETWELKFRPALAEPIELVVSRRTKLETKTPVSLPALIDATSQQGSGAVELTGNILPKLQERRLRPLAPQTQRASQQQSVLKAFEYDPTETLLAAEGPALLLNVERGAKNDRPAWIWRCDLNSWFSNSASASHRATWLVENSGRSNLILVFPRADGVPEVSVDGTRQVDGVSYAADGALTIQLPHNRRFCSLEIQWNTPESGLAGFSKRSVAWPLADVPILARSATIWLPGGYKVANTSQIQRLSAGEVPSWRQRLFGPLGRSKDNETFEPWLARDWTRLARDFSDANFVRRYATEFVHQPVSAGASESPDARRALATSIGAQLDRAWRQVGLETTTVPPLFVHVEALKRAGIAPSAFPVADHNGGNPPADVGELLRRFGLVLCVDPQGVLLTSRQWAATACDPSFATAREPLIPLESSLTLDELLSSTSNSGMNITVPLETWLSLPEGVQSPWQVARLAADQLDLPSHGWVAFPVEWFTPDRELRFWVIRRDTLLALAVGVFLTAAGLVWRLGDTRLLFRAVSLAILSIVALLLPVDFVPLGAAAVLGFLTGHFCLWCFRSPAQAEKHAAGEVATPLTATATLLLILTHVCTLAAADDPVQSGPASANAHIYDVMIPIDENQKVAGEIVYVPEELYRRLAVATTHDPSAADRFLVKSAKYEPLGNAVATGSQPTRQDWKATYDIEVLEPATEVILPLAAVGAELIPDAAMLDGRPLRFGWNPQRTAVVFNVKQPGSHQVQFLLRPLPQRAAGGSGFNVSIPAVPDCRISVPALDAQRAPRVDAQGMSRFDRATGRMEVELGPMEHLAVSWSDTARQPVAAQFDVDELMWLKVRPGSALFNVRLIVDVRQGALNELRVAVDRRLAFLSANNGARQIKAVPAGDGSELRLTLDQSLTDRAAIDLAFAVSDASVVGEFIWPKIRLLGSESSRRYAAWTVDPSLEWIASPSPAMKPIAASQFAALWGDAEGRPVAYELPAADSASRFEVQPRQPKIQSSDRTIAVVERSLVRVDWISSLEITGGSRFQLRTEVPPELVLDEVEVRDTAGIRPSRWARSRDHALSLFFDAPATGKQQILVRARLPIGERGRVSLPLLKLEGANSAPPSLLVFRRQNALVTVEEKLGVSALSTAEATRLADQFAASGLVEQARFGDLRLVAALDVQPDAGRISLNMQENRPQTDAAQVISLSKSGEIWHAAMDLKLNVRAGLLDTIRIDLPSSWTGPFRTEPALPSELLDVPGETRRQLLLRPAQPVTGQTSVRIEAPLAIAPGQRVRAPDARFVGADSLQEFLALPSQQELRTLAWDTRGLKPEPIPEELLRRPAAVEAFQTFARAADEVRAELRSVERIADDIQVRLADIVVHWTSDGSCYGAATFDVEPAGRTSCRLALPPTHQLINLNVDGRPLAVEPVGDQRWSVPLSGGRLPQRIEVVYAGRFTEAAGAPQLLNGPRLIGLPVERTLWTVSGPRWAGQEHSSVRDPANALRQDAARHESIAAVIESAANALVEAPADEAPRWYSLWAGYLMTAQRSFEQQVALDASADPDGELTSKAEVIADDQHLLAERLGLDTFLEQWTNRPMPASTSSAVWRGTLEPRAVASHAILLGENPTLALGYSRQTPGDLDVRVVLVLVVALLLLGAVALILYTPLIEWVSNRPRALGVALGLFWWLFLWPSALGWVIVLASLLYRRLGRLVPWRLRPGLRSWMA